ncbi:unnamed protein product, partial [Amoebophrya sp. A120]
VAVGLGGRKSSATTSSSTEQRCNYSYPSSNNYPGAQIRSTTAPTFPLGRADVVGPFHNRAESDSEEDSREDGQEGLRCFEDKDAALGNYAGGYKLHHNNLSRRPRSVQQFRRKAPLIQREICFSPPDLEEVTSSTTTQHGEKIAATVRRTSSANATNDGCSNEQPEQVYCVERPRGQAQLSGSSASIHQNPDMIFANRTTSAFEPVSRKIHLQPKLPVQRRRGHDEDDIKAGDFSLQDLMETGKVIKAVEKKQKEAVAAGAPTSRVDDEVQEHQKLCSSSRRIVEAAAGKNWVLDPKSQHVSMVQKQAQELRSPRSKKGDREKGHQTESGSRRRNKGEARVVPGGHDEEKSGWGLYRPEQEVLVDHAAPPAPKKLH